MLVPDVVERHFIVLIPPVLCRPEVKIVHSLPVPCRPEQQKKNAKKKRRIPMKKTIGSLSSKSLILLGLLFVLPATSMASMTLSPDDYSYFFRAIDSTYVVELNNGSLSSLDNNAGLLDCDTTNTYFYIVDSEANVKLYTTLLMLAKTTDRDVDVYLKLGDCTLEAVRLK
jgi:hypothetical protein